MDFFYFLFSCRYLEIRKINLNHPMLSRSIWADIAAKPWNAWISGITIVFPFHLRVLSLMDHLLKF